MISLYCVSHALHISAKNKFCQSQGHSSVLVWPHLWSFKELKGPIFAHNFKYIVTIGDPIFDIAMAEFSMRLQK